MEGFGHHSAVSELLGQIQALAYERHSLKFDGRVRHSRRIDQLLTDIGRKSLQLLDPVSRLYQEHEDLSQLICTAYANECPGHDTGAGKMSLVSKLHHLLGSLRQTGAAQQRFLEEKMCQHMMKAQQLAEDLSRAASPSASTSLSRIPDTSKGDSRPASNSERPKLSGSCSYNGNLSQAALMSANGSSLQPFTMLPDHMDAEKFRARIVQLESIVKKLLKSVSSKSSSSDLATNSSENSAASPPLNQVSRENDLCLPSKQSCFASAGRKRESFHHDETTTEIPARATSESNEAFLRDECRMVVNELSRAMSKAEKQGGSLARQGYILPIKSKVAVRELLKNSIRSRSMGMWHPPIHRPSASIIALPVAPSQLPQPSSTLFAAAGALKSDPSQQLVRVNAGAKTFSGPNAILSPATPMLKPDADAVILHCVSGRSSARLFEPSMHMDMDLLLPDTLGIREDAKDLAPPVSPLFSRLMSLMESLEPSDPAPEPCPKLSIQADCFSGGSKDSRYNLADSGGSCVRSLPEKHVQVSSSNMESEACGKIKKQGRSLLKNDDVCSLDADLDIGRNSKSTQCTKIKSKSQAPKHCKGSCNLERRSEIQTTATGMLELPPILSNKQEVNQNMQCTQPPSAGVDASVQGGHFIKHQVPAPDTATTGFSAAPRWKFSIGYFRGQRKVSGKVVASGKCRLGKVVGRAKTAVAISG